MSFDSPQFWLLFLPIVFIITFLPRRSVSWQNSTLLIASLIFYYSWAGYFVVVLIFVLLVNFTTGRLLENASAVRTNVITISVVIIDLSVLLLFRFIAAPVGDNVLTPIGLS